MKVTLKTLSIAIAAFAVGLTSCSNNQETGSGAVTPTGEATNFELKIGIPATKSTRATDPQATGDELKINDVTVFIFNENGLFESKASFTATNLQQDGTDKNKWVINQKINSTTGKKKFAVGVNIAGLTLPAITKIADLHTAMSANLSQLTSSTGVASMFSNVIVDATLVSKTDPAYPNEVTAGVERMIAKVAVEEGNNFATVLTANGVGTYSNVQFAMRQSNIKLFPMRTLNNGIIVDPNWDTYNAGDFENFSNYVSINAYNTSLDPKSLVGKYCGENTSKTHLEKESTYASIKTIFIPNKFADADGVETAHNGTAVTYWVATHDDGTVLFFKDETTIDNYMGSATAIAKDAKKITKPYTNGETYFTAFVNKGNGVNVIRNNFYNIVITKISAPGNPTPDPKDPEEEVTVPTDIDFTVNILPWVFSSEDHEL